MSLEYKQQTPVLPSAMIKL